MENSNKEEVDVKRVLAIIEGLGFRFKRREEIQHFLKTRCLVQLNKGTTTLHIDGVIAGKFTN